MGDLPNKLKSQLSEKALTPTQRAVNLVMFEHKTQSEAARICRVSRQAVSQYMAKYGLKSSIWPEEMFGEPDQ